MNDRQQEQWNPAASLGFFFGIVGVIVGLIPFAGILAIIPGLLALLFGFTGRTAAKQMDGFGHPRATTAVGLGIAAILLALIQAFGWQVGSSDPEPDTEASSTNVSIRRS